MDKKILKLKEKLKKQGIKGLALDIDETLSHTNLHWFEHMFNFHKLEGLSEEEAHTKYINVENVFEWQTEEGKNHIKKILHSNDFNATIPLVQGADETVQEINKIIPIVAYITARPETVIEGTIKWLKKHNFPEAELITRPRDVIVEEYGEFNLNKNKWKAGVLDVLYPEVLGIVDDNPVLAHELMSLNYKGILYLYGKEGKEFENHKNVIVCPTWQDVLNSIKK